MEKKIEGGFIVFIKKDDKNEVGCHIKLGHTYNEAEIEATLDKALKDLRNND